jgi:hypothetical protein
MGRLLIKFPTRNRPDKFKYTFDRYVSFLSGRHRVRFVVSLDEDDETMNNEAVRDWLDQQARGIDLKYTYGHSRTKIEAVNRDMEGEDGDVLLVASDDMNPVKRQYDHIIFKAFERVFPDFDGAVKFWDGDRPPWDALMTLAVLGFPLYRRFGYIYHPDYKSVYADNEQSEVCMMMKRLVFSQQCIIKHEWTPEPFDTLHARNQTEEMYRNDHSILLAHRARRFDIDTNLGPDAVRPGPSPLHGLMNWRRKLRIRWRRLVRPLR